MTSPLMTLSFTKNHSNIFLISLGRDRSEDALSDKAGLKKKVQFEDPAKMIVEKDAMI